jgi:hypothetical protein
MVNCTVLDLKGSVIWRVNCTVLDLTSSVIWRVNCTVLDLTGSVIWRVNCTLTWLICNFVSLMVILIRISTVPIAN